MNWYKIATAEKKPYRIYKVDRGQDIEILKLRHIWAFSSEQARMEALRKSPELKDFVEHCFRSNADCDVVAKLDQIELESVQKYQEALKRRDERKLQNAWWRYEN